MADYAGHDSILIADVDCTAAGKELCEEVGVQGYPTLKFGDPNNLEDYEGGRDFDALSKFAKEKLGPTCGPDHLELCDAAKKEKIEKFMAMPIAELKEQVAEEEASLAATEKEFEEFVKGLQSQYEEGQKEKDAKKAAIKESGLGLMKSVAAHRKNAKSEL
uniref:Thioredoxin domain-containing protein n=1 Tax=Pyrodinium bahamense TaxID=73915 RepID=A0A6T9AP79_9DINO|mmetsp:Transcript_50360/g.139825  ORF Transcript_50360/g.139825 Transcript_50360/m.139825 type:complete len:161 (+) Transcript_50360:62-544(+)